MVQCSVVRCTVKVAWYGQTKLLMRGAGCTINLPGTDDWNGLTAADMTEKL